MYMVHDFWLYAIVRVYAFPGLLSWTRAPAWSMISSSLTINYPLDMALPQFTYSP